MAYNGGKGQDGVYQRIISQMPPHSRYVEAFVGGGAIMKAKRPAAHWTIAIDADPEACTAFRDDAGSAGIPDLDVLNVDAIAWLTDFGPAFGKETLIYCDPPYLGSTRRQNRQIYRYEMLGEQEHERLLLLLKSLKCLVMISGYWSQFYANLLSDWRAVSFQAVTRGGSLATEWLWCNFPEPTELHDYRYLGANFRERERIKRKKARWVNRLRSMPTLERQALSAALAEVSEG